MMGSVPRLEGTASRCEADQIVGLTCNCCVSVAAGKILYSDLCLKFTQWTSGMSTSQETQQTSEGSQCGLCSRAVQRGTSVL